LEDIVSDAAFIGGAHQVVTQEELDAFLTAQLAEFPVDGKKVVLVVPDGTRSCPLPRIMGTVYRELIERVSSLTALIALGTHAYMTPDELERWFGANGVGLAAKYPGMTVLNHEWKDPVNIVEVGTIGADDIERLSGGRLKQDVRVEVNRLVAQADVSIVIGPVFPHEVVGISGGNKYFIPGCATHEIIDLSHWLGALIGIDDLIGQRGITPVRAVINAASELIPTHRMGICLVVKSGTDEIEYVATGELDDAWALSSEVAADSHIEYVDKPFKKVVAMMPTRYADMWTAAKGCYKIQPAMAEGGEVIIYAPHVKALAEQHPEIYDIGYHCMDYFIKQWDRFKDVPTAVLAHSTHVRGGGTFDPSTGIETNRIKLTLCTQVPREIVEAANASYLSPDEIDLEALRADPDVFVEPNAGEVLFRLKSG